MNILNLLQRVTNSGNKILYIDGLRFFSIFIVFIAHFIDYYTDYNIDFEASTSLSRYQYIGTYGVYFFFGISGFIIALPFIKQHVYNGHKVSIKQYFLKRLTRLEPPYIILLTLFFLMQTVIFKSKSFDDLLPHYLASLIYCNNIIYHEFPIINPVLWSLEIEVQFYILAPIFLLIFKINKYTRRLILIFIILSWNYLSFIPQLDFANLLNYLPYFLTGILSADFYLDYNDKITKNLVFDVLCVIAFVIFYTNPHSHLFYLAIFILLLLSSKSKFFIKLLEYKFIYIAGGMCYSVYMLHQKIIFYLDFIYPKNYIFFNNYYADFSIKLIISAIFILLISSIFFIFVERPTMKREWWKYRSFKKLFFK